MNNDILYVCKNLICGLLGTRNLVDTNNIKIASLYDAERI